VYSRRQLSWSLTNLESYSGVEILWIFQIVWDNWRETQTREARYRNESVERTTRSWIAMEQQTQWNHASALITTACHGRRAKERTWREQNESRELYP
jgi:hypothetical protein